jgi:hypothetical protein
LTLPDYNPEDDLTYRIQELEADVAGYKQRVADLERMCREREETIDELTALLEADESAGVL